MRGELDDIGLAGEAEAEGAEAESAGDAEAGSGLGGAVVGAVVEDAALGGETVFGPGLLDMNEGPLPLAEGEVLEAGERQQVVFEKA